MLRAATIESHLPALLPSSRIYCARISKIPRRELTVSSQHMFHSSDKRSTVILTDSAVATGGAPFTDNGIIQGGVGVWVAAI